jgi:beta-lactamase regulating signal transducer with metallopeptidase domain
VHQNRTYRLLIGLGLVSALLLVAAILRTVLAGCPDGCGEPMFQCLFIPTHADMSTHLISYAFLGTVLLSTLSGLLLWHRQLVRVHRIIMNLARLQVPEDELVPLLQRLGLEGKVRLVDSDAPVCFCAGFLSPRIYVSRGTLAKLTAEELEALLAHEKHHLVNNVPLKILFGRCLTSALFFIPYLRDLLQKYLIEEEIAADETAIRQQGHQRGIINAIGKLLSQSFTDATPGYAVGATGALAYRIDHLMGKDTECTVSCNVARMVISLVVTAVITAAALHPVVGSHTVPHLTNLFAASPA